MKYIDISILNKDIKHNMRQKEIYKILGIDYYKPYPQSQGRKQCSICNKIKKVGAFCKNRKYEDGYHVWCIDCTNKINENREVQEYFATPDLITDEQKKQLLDLENDRKMSTKRTGKKHAICHIDPIQHWLICGLNIPANMHVDTQENNCRSSNNFSSYHIDEDGTIEHINLPEDFIIHAYYSNEEFNEERNQNFKEGKENNIHTKAA